MRTPGPKIEKEISLGQHNQVDGPIKEIFLIFRLFIRRTADLKFRRCKH